MTISYSGTSSSSANSTSTPQSVNFTESYNTVYASSTTYKINLVYSGSGVNETTTVWILKNGTTIAADVSGYNLTGIQVEGMAAGLFAGFSAQIQADNQVYIYTGANFFHSTGTSSVTIGQTTMTVTNYEANTLPLTINECGVDSTLTAFALSVGTPPGGSGPLVTYEHFAGSEIVNGGQQNTYDIVIQVTALTVA